VLRPRNWAAVAAALAVTVAMSLAVPTDARADRCNPDEMVGPQIQQVTGQPYEPVFGHDDGPFCYAMRTVVYPAVGCDPAVQNLMQCIQAQPDRARAFASGMCAESLDEVVEASAPAIYALQEAAPEKYVAEELRILFVIIGRYANTITTTTGCE
jgi:hypothetical protein